MVWMYGKWDFEKAEKDFKHAMKLNPRYPTVHQWYALCVAMRGRLAEARAELRRAIELDPLAPIFTHNLAWILSYEHSWTESLATAKAGLEFAPEFPWLHQIAGQALLQLGRADESLVHLRKAVELAPLASFPYGYLGHALARSGHEQEARALLAERLEYAGTHYAPPTDVAMIYVGLGELDAAIQWLEKGLEVRDTWMVFLGVATQWDSLRNDPRFVVLLRRVGLPDLRAGNAPADSSNLRPAP
jgi:Flp pilus assembly protein TadD